MRNVRILPRLPRIQRRLPLLRSEPVTWPGWHFRHKRWHDWAVTLLSLCQCGLVYNSVHKYTMHFVGKGHIDPYALTTGIITGCVIQAVWSNAKRNHQ